MSRLFVFLILGTICSSCLGGKCNWTRPKKACIPGFNIKSVFVKGILGCKKHCEEEPRCRSINLQQSNNKCYLHSANSNSRSYREPCGTEYYSECTRADMCAGVTCQNGGTCKTEGSSYSCSCAADYTGRHCETVKCNWSRPKKACIPGFNIKSMFVKGFLECKKHCEEEPKCRSIDLQQTNNKCYLNSVTSTSSSYREPCGTEYYSECTRADVCAGVTCQNGGTCKDEGSSYSCSCAADYTGRHCETVKCEWTRPKKACIPGFNIKSMFVKGFLECKKHCEEEPKCRSIDLQQTNNKCYLNSVTSTSSSYREPCGTEYYSECTRAEKCKWSLPKNGACIPGFNIKSMFVKGFLECKKHCEEEPKCRSIDLQPTNNKCYLNSVTSTSSSYTEHCGTEYYSECTR